MRNLKAPDRMDIPVGRKNAIGRAELAMRWGLSDRKMRETVAEMRADISADDGYAILSTSTAPAGYWRSNNPKELQAFINETEGRAKMNYAALRGAKKLLNRINARGQMTMDSVMKGA